MASGQFPSELPKAAGGPPPLPGPAAAPPAKPPIAKSPAGPPPMPGPAAKPPVSIPMSAPMPGATPSGPLSTGPQSLPTGAQSLGAATPPASPPASPPNVPPRNPPKQPPRGAEPPKRSTWKQPLILGALIGTIVAVIAIAFLVNLARKRNHLFERNAADKAAVQVEIATVPAAASVRVNGETKCNAPCAVPLTPGTYQVTAFLDGYEPAAGSVTVTAGQPANVSLTLVAQAQTVRILTDLDQGKIVIDDQPPAELQEGQFILDNVAPGSHTVKVTGKSGEASFTFDIAEAKPPVITGTPTAKNLNALLVSSFGNQARVVTNAGPLKLAVNGSRKKTRGRRASISNRSCQAWMK